MRLNSGIYLAAIISLALFLRLFVASDPYLHPWDERFHALVAKHIMEDPLRPTLYTAPILPTEEEHWSTDQLWLHKQPLPLWTMASSMKLFGANEWGLRLPSVLLSTLSIYWLFLLGRRLFDDSVGLIAAFLLAINGLVLDLTGGRVATDHIDLYFLFFVLLAIFFAERHSQKRHWSYLLGIGLATGAAILSKWLPALVVFPVWGLFYWHYHVKTDKHWWRGMALTAGITFLVAAPWQIYTLQTFPEAATRSFAFNRRHIFDALDGHGQPFYYHFLKIGRIYGVLMYAALSWLIYHIVRYRADRFKYAALLCWIGLPLLFFSLAKTKMQAYTIFSAPAYLMVYAIAVKVVWQSLSRKKGPLSYLVLLLFFLQPILYSVERAKLTAKRTVPQWKQEILTLGNKIAADSLAADAKVVVFNAAHPIETMFYLDHTTAYGFTPAQAVQDSLRAAGIKLYWMEPE